MSLRFFRVERSNLGFTEVISGPIFPLFETRLAFVQVRALMLFGFNLFHKVSTENYENSD